MENIHNVKRSKMNDGSIVSMYDKREQQAFSHEKSATQQQGSNVLQHQQLETNTPLLPAQQLPQQAGSQESIVYHSYPQQTPYVYNNGGFIPSSSPHVHFQQGNVYQQAPQQQQYIQQPPQQFHNIQHSSQLPQQYSLHCQQAQVYGPHTYVQETTLTIEDLRDKFPNLHKIGYLDERRSCDLLTLGYLAQLDMTQRDKSYSAPKSLEDQLDINAGKVLVSTRYKEEEDNLQDKLHTVRFQRFPVGPATQLNIMAAERISKSQE